MNDSILSSGLGAAKGTVPMPIERPAAYGNGGRLPQIELADLQRLRRSGPHYLMAICPYHNDRKPSLSVHLGTGRAYCFACEAKAIVRSLGGRALEGASRYRPAPRLAPAFDEQYLAAATRRCSEITSVELMLRRRGISPDTADELGMRGLCDRHGAEWLNFVYRDQNHRPLYWKQRPADGSKDIMLRYPPGVATSLYNLPALRALPSTEAPMVVEGELDVAALFELGFRGVVSVPDGAGSRLTRTLLKPLDRFTDVFIGTDTDEAGIKLAHRLAALLAPIRCYRVTWEASHGG